MNKKLKEQLRSFAIVKSIVTFEESRSLGTDFVKEKDGLLRTFADIDKILKESKDSKTWIVFDSLASIPYK